MKLRNFRSIFSRITKDSSKLEWKPPYLSPKCPPQDIEEVTNLMERQLFAYLPEWMTENLKLRGLSEHLARNLLTVYWVHKKEIR